MSKGKVNLPRAQFARGLVQVYTGNGKGKTTAALGLALRAAGHGLRVYIAQFMKGVEYGELASLAKIAGITIEQFGSPRWIDPKAVTEEDKQQAEAAFAAASQAVLGGEYDIVILDEANVALAWGLLPLAKVVELIRMKPLAVEMVLTGRNAPAELIDLADLVTEMRQIKHPFEKGVGGRQGIEF